MNLHGTPGPFVAREEKRPGDAPRITVQAANGVVLAELSNYNATERRTLARQFAAAPDMQAALLRLSASYARLKPPGYPRSDAEKQADAAIAKATGSAS